MDHISACYEQGMRCYIDRPDIVVPGRWHFCKPGAKYIPYPHVFASASWDEKTFEYEEFGDVRMTPFVTVPDKDVPGADGQHFCGTERMWTQGCFFSEAGGFDAVMGGGHECCAVEITHPVGVEMGAGGRMYRSLWLSGTAKEEEGVTGFMTPDWWMAGPGATEAGAGGYMTASPWLIGPAGTEEGVAAFLTEGLAMPGSAGTEEGVTGYVSNSPVSPGAAGTEEGATGFVTNGPVELGAAGTEEGAEGFMGVSVGLVGAAGTEDAALGEMEASEDEDPEPGGSCAEAGTIPLGEDIVATVNAMGTHWWKFPVENGVTYRVTYSLDAGDSTGAAQLFSGTCAGLVDQGLLTMTGCQDFTAGADGFGYVRILGGTIGSTDYTINADEGTCP